MIFSIQNVSCGYENRTVLRDISFDVCSNEVLCLLGPNGCGKTTLFKTVMGFLKSHGGIIAMDGEDISGWTQKKRAGNIGYVPQSHTPAFPFSVFDVILMGRNSQLTRFAFPSDADGDIVMETMELLKICHLSDRNYTELSGGERQMVLIARALAQRPRLLVLDEPTSNLDYGNQVKVLEVVADLADGGLGVIMTTHTPDHAFICGTKAVLLDQSGSVLMGTVDEIVTEDNLHNAYGVKVKVLSAEDDGFYVKGCIPVTRRIPVER